MTFSIYYDSNGSFDIVGSRNFLRWYFIEDFSIHGVYLDWLDSLILLKTGGVF